MIEPLSFGFGQARAGVTSTFVDRFVWLMPADRKARRGGRAFVGKC